MCDPPWKKLEQSKKLPPHLHTSIHLISIKDAHDVFQLTINVASKSVSCNCSFDMNIQRSTIKNVRV